MYSWMHILALLQIALVYTLYACYYIVQKICEDYLLADCFYT